MKKIISALLVFILLVGCIFALASCGTLIPSGTYEDALGVSEFKVSGNTMTVDESGVEVVYTYKIKSDEDDSDAQVIILTFKDAKYDGDNEIVKGVLAEIKKEAEKDPEADPVKFEMGDGWFKMGGVKYTKK